MRVYGCDVTDDLETLCELEWDPVGGNWIAQIVILETHDPESSPG